VTQEMDGLTAMLEGTGYVGLVHGDACPDNVRLLPGGARIFDFETSGWGPVALDASYLLAPFPSCWCFASLPAEAAAPAVAAYRAAVEAAGVRLGPDWDAATAAALIGWVIARGRVISRALDEDRDWGTTSMRPRLLTWLRSFTETAGRTGALPRLRALADGMHEQLSARWYQTVIPEYPALARPGAAPVQVPGWWRPGS
jgi:Ser/Thr protein kinase RdoA (MazF antagonist)